MVVLVVTSAAVLPASAYNSQPPVRSHAASDLHFHPLRHFSPYAFRCRKHHPYGSPCIDHSSYSFTGSFRTRSKSLQGKKNWRLLAGLGDDIKSNHNNRRRSGQFLGLFLKRGNSGTDVGDESQQSVNDSSTSRQGPEKDRFRTTFEFLEDGIESPIKPFEIIKSEETPLKDQLLEAALKRLNRAKEIATNASNYFISVDASPGTPLFPFLGDSFLGLGSLVLVAIVLSSWWRKFLRGKKTVKNEGLYSASAATTIDVQKAQAAVAAPVALSMLLQSDMKKKESAEWLNMVLGKVWNLYRRKLENTLVEAIQPVIDEIPEKPPQVERVVLKQFFLGDEPVLLRTIERRTSRRANDLQYHVGLRYTGNSRMVFSIALKFGFLAIKIPISIRGLDLDGEVWVKLRLIPAEPWVGTATWAFVSPPKVTLALAPFKFLNLMAVPFLNIFLTQLLTKDLPRLFVRPNKQVINYLKGETSGPLAKDFKDGIFEVKGFAGELSITLLEARKLNYFPIGQIDPYVVFLLGEQTFRSKRNSKTSITGPPGAPVWNQDFRMLVVNPATQKLRIRVRDFVGFLGLTTITVGYIEIPIDDLQDTVPVDRVLTLRNDRWFFLGRNAGELMLRLTYKAYVAEEEEEAGIGDRPVTNNVLNEIGNFISKEMEETDVSPEKRQLRDAIVMSVDARRGASGFRFSNPLMTQSTPVVSKPSSVTIDPVTGLVNPNSFVHGPPNPSYSEPETPEILSNPALENQEEKEGENWALQFNRFRQENSALLWLAIVTGVALVVALDLNLSNLFNP